MESTNNKAKELVVPENEYIIYTKNQTGGRGQYDRKWISNKGITFSIVLKEENEEYYKIVPNAIINYLKEKNIDAEIKLQNDIFYNGKKLGGILIENIYQENKYDKTIIGIGLNINEDKSIENTVENSICINIKEKTENIIKNIYKNIIICIN